MSPTDARLEQLIAEGQERGSPTLIPREVRLRAVPGKADALVGMRRSGTTYRLFGEMQALVARGVPRSRLLFLNLEDDRLGRMDVAAPDRALEIFYQRGPAARVEGAWLFLDEVQVVPEWERFARRVLDTEDARLFLTGSSARLLSTEVAAAFRRRSTTVEVLPYSVREAAVADGLDAVANAERRSALDAAIAKHLVTGGFPAVRALEPYDRVQLLQGYVDLVVLRDVAERHAASNLAVLRELVAAQFAANTNGFSVSRLHGALTSQGWRVAKATLLDYLGLLIDGRRTANGGAASASPERRREARRARSGNASRSGAARIGCFGPGADCIRGGAHPN